MNWFERVTSGNSPFALIELYLTNVFGGALSTIVLDIFLILGLHAVTVFLVTILFMKIATKTHLCQGFFGGFSVYLVATLLILLSHVNDIIILSITLNSLNVFPDPMQSFYYVVGLYTTVGSNYNPPLAWQGLALIIPFCGLFSFSLSGSALFTMLGYFFGAPKPLAKNHEDS